MIERTALDRRRSAARERPPDRMRFVLWCAFIVGVLAAARATYVQVSEGAEFSRIALLSLANAVVTGGLFALVAAAVVRPGDR